MTKLTTRSKDRLIELDIEQNCGCPLGGLGATVPFQQPKMQNKTQLQIDQLNYCPPQDPCSPNIKKGTVFILNSGKILNVHQIVYSIKSEHIFQKNTFIAFKNLEVPLWAIVPRQSISSSLVIPMPVSLLIGENLGNNLKNLTGNWNCKQFKNSVPYSDGPIVWIRFNADFQITSIPKKPRLSHT